MPGVTVLLDLERVRPLILDGVAKALQRTDARIAAPRKGQFGHASGADQLVVGEVGRHPYEVQIATTLTDDLVSGRMRNEVGEAFERQRVAVVHVLGDGRFQRGDHRAYHGGIWASTLIQMLLASVYSRIASNPISRP